MGGVGGSLASVSAPLNEEAVQAHSVGPEAPPVRVEMVPYPEPSTRSNFHRAPPRALANPLRKPVAQTAWGGAEGT